MGEYATINATGETVKIGTCESLYYLRFDQRELVTPEAGWPDIYRYRFPFPDEDSRAIEDMMSVDRFERGVTVYGVKAPDGVDHYSVQFRNEAIGYNLCIDCPESHAHGEEGFGPIDVNGVKVHRNGFRGAVQIVSQRYLHGKLMTVLRCACGAMWRLPTLADAEPVIESFLAQAAREERETEMRCNRERINGREREAAVASAGRWYKQMAVRVGAGYTDPHRDWHTATVAA